MSMVKDSILVKIGGKTGEGIDSMGEMLVYIAKECGLEGNTFRSFPTVIVGGNTTYEAHLSSRRIYARGNEVDILVALHQESMDELVGEMAQEALAIYDPAIVTQIPEGAPSQQFIAIPFKQMAKEIGSDIMRNMVALGVLVRLLDLDLEAGYTIIEKRFGSKGEKIVEQNKLALKKGYEYNDERLTLTLDAIKKPDVPTPKLLMSGNEAMSYGALAAQCRVFAGYPITPASDILEWMAKKLPEVGGYCLQMEDEIAALCTVIGASFTGVRAMTATSGPGISLMTEAMGLAGMTEVPVVIIDTQRPGPSAGMPTRHEQSDIKHLIHGSHGEFPRIVISPGTVDECIEDMVAAFNLADYYQCPVIIAADQDLALRKQTIDLDLIDVDSFTVDRGKIADPNTPNYKRYLDTPDGISPRAFPGQENMLFVSSGDEHHEDGSIDLYDPKERIKMVSKRMRKIEKMDASRYQPIRLYGPEHARTLIIGMGSTKGPILEVIRQLPDTRYMQIKRLWPFPTKEVEPVLNEVETIIVVEHNYQGQLAYLIRAELPVHHKIHSVLKYDGTPFTPKELLEEVKQCLPTKIS